MLVVVQTIHNTHTCRKCCVETHPHPRLVFCFYAWHSCAELIKPLRAVCVCCASCSHSWYDILIILKLLIYGWDSLISFVSTVIECTWAQCHPVFRQIPWKAIWMWTFECELRYRSTNESEIDLDLNECEHFLNVKLDRGSINVGSIYINIFMYHKRYEQLYDLGMCKDWVVFHHSLSINKRHKWLS